MNQIICTDYEQLSETVAAKIADWINKNPGSLLCLAAGDTPLSAYAKLVKLQDMGAVDLSSVYYVGLDEWVGLGMNDKGSCKQVMFDNFYGPANIPEAHIRVFDGLVNPEDACKNVSEWIDRHGGIGLTLLGVGLNGHVGFNEPGAQSLTEKGCSPVPLDNTTLKVSNKYFDRQQAVSQGITVCLPTLKAAKKMILMLSGNKKKAILERMLNEPPSMALPASLLLDHPDLDLICDFVPGTALFTCPGNPDKNGEFHSSMSD